MGNNVSVVVRKSFIEIDESRFSPAAITRSAPGTPLSVFRRARDSPMASMLCKVTEGMANCASFTEDIPVTPSPACHRVQNILVSEMLFRVNEGAEATADNDVDDDEVGEVRLPTAARWSVGSQGHAHGECKPCGFFWSAKGCHYGEDCQHCHICDESVRKTRKKDCASAKRRRARNGRASRCPVL